MLTSTKLPQALYQAEQVRTLDRMLIDELSISGFELMQKAASYCFEEVEKLRTKDLVNVPLWVFCGKGNNGGDGMVLAALAQQRGWQVRLVFPEQPDNLSGDAAKALAMVQEAQVPIVPLPEAGECDGCLLVDALFGTGLKREVAGSYASAIEYINASKKSLVVAVDLPSGLCADSGAILATAVRAHTTVTFIALKQGMFTAEGPELCGNIQFAPLLDINQLKAVPVPTAMKLDVNQFHGAVAKRPRNAHKGKFGHVVVVGGNLGMPGAAILTAHTALRMGSGLVTLITRPQHVAAATACCPAMMVYGLDFPSDTKPLLPKADVLVVGPGLGNDAWAEQMLYHCLMSDKPLVVDADGLNLLAENDYWCQKPPKNWLLTPHPGEAARLLNLKEGAQAVQKERFIAVQQLQKKYQATVILKGAGTLICSADKAITLCSHGNPGMASAGMGDCLAGVLAALLGFGLPFSTVANYGVCLHAKSADMAAAEHGEYGLLAQDLLPYLRNLINHGAK